MVTRLSRRHIFVNRDSACIGAGRAGGCRYCPTLSRNWLNRWDFLLSVPGMKSAMGMVCVWLRWVVMAGDGWRRCRKMAPSSVSNVR